MRYVLDEQQCRNLTVSKSREWLLANGVGGYAMGTVCGLATRRYHGLLVAATTPPGGRRVLLSSMDAFVQAGNSNPVGLSSNQYPGVIYPEGYLYLKHFHVDQEAVWIFRAGECEVERCVRVLQGSNSTCVEYTNIGDHSLTMTLRPFVAHKPFHENFRERSDYPLELSFLRDKTLIRHDGTDLWLTHVQAERSPVQGWYYRFEYDEEVSRGLEARDDLYCPCELRYELSPGESAVVMASTEEGVRPWPRPQPESGNARLTTALKEAASKFVVRTEARTTIIAGYPWFSDWGRDTMISLPGILLHTGRVEDARRVLRDFGVAMHRGLIPNRFTESGGADYNTVDASLWFVNSIYKSLEFEWNEEFAIRMLDCIRELVRCHVEGTLFGIRVDPADGLLAQGETGLQLTWMDAKIGDWVVTPRHGKPVEVNGLWINALRAAEWIASRLGIETGEYTSLAEAAEASFERKFWHEGLGYFVDTADPVDASLRPNQIIAMAMPFSPVSAVHARRALKVVEQELLTPYGLRTLGPKEPGYIGKFQGQLPQLDAAYHQGTVWPWLLGSYCTAVVKYRGDILEAKRLLANAKSMLFDRGLGGIAEVYDGDAPQTPGGCPWQAWSVAEILRSWIEDASAAAS